MAKPFVSPLLCLSLTNMFTRRNVALCFDGDTRPTLLELTLPAHYSRYLAKLGRSKDLLTMLRLSPIMLLGNLSHPFRLIELISESDYTTPECLTFVLSKKRQ